MRREIGNRARLALALGLLTILIGACGGSDGSSEADVDASDWGATINPGGEPVTGGNLRIDIAAAPAGLTPLVFIEEPSNSIIQVTLQMFEGLVAFEPGSIDPQPALARDWTISEDGLTYTFELRDAEFSNGMPVTSADVKYILEKARDSFFAELFGVISRIETPDPKTVVLRLSEPTPAMLVNLTTAAAAVVPSKLVESEGVEAFNDDPVGSGPFMLDEWKRDQSVTLVRNDNYWDEGRPYLDSVEIVTTPDDNTRILNVESGSTDVADPVPFGQIDRINDSGEATVLVGPGSDMYVVFLNNSRAPLDELPVRQALNYATPVDSIVDAVFKGHAERMNTIIPKLKYWTDEAEAYPYDPEQAEQLLSESSVPDGFSATLNVNGDDQDSRQVAQILQDSWSEIGVDLKIRPLDEAAHGDDFTSGRYELSLSRPGEVTSDPVDDQFARLLFSSQETHNLFTFSKSPEAARYARQATSELDEERRRDLFEQMHIASMENPPVVPLIYTPNRAAVADDVHDLSYLLSAWWPLDLVWKQ